jgi:hypothetical protein
MCVCVCVRARECNMCSYGLPVREICSRVNFVCEFAQRAVGGKHT